MIDAVLSRIKIRLTAESYDEAVLGELAQTTLDRLSIRLGVNEDTFPSSFYSIAVDATVKSFRRLYYEGITSEGVANLSTSFVDDILSEYACEIELYRKEHGEVVRFL